MSDALWLLLAAATSLAGMAWLALAMEVHWEQVMGRPAHAATTTATARGWLRRLGALALPLSLGACLMADRPSMAVLVWLMLLAASAVVVAGLLAYRPRLLAVLWPGRTGGLRI